MNSFTRPYNVNLTLGSNIWKTEYTTNYLPSNELNSPKNKYNFNKHKQNSKPFSQYKIQ